MVRTWTTRLVLGLIAPAFALGCGSERHCCCPCQNSHPAAESAPVLPAVPANPAPQTPATPMSATRTASATVPSTIPQLAPVTKPIRME